jgi:hypothetical protein
MVHMVAELNRHAGHVDILRELLDSAVGYNAGNANLPDREDTEWWAAYYAKVEEAARSAQ